ncbi:RAMP superfamily CRISPR-associated protein [Aulosira sp. FACHB-615]|uniref:RAMP superfamily CRISPR-associated protein n=1 Tax=Aulosira sp. FACHB-615 TaxID=2692777 RepID=UPI001689FCBE|nr:RAMP superfamily CRISPR-associated protein [Aulosira sp. FACHB-615]MBD2491468.1 CRISPR-associated protein [Aulosira sp. FACHB-615]
MHKRLVNHCTIDFSIIPVGPILIKSGKEGADPTKPNMEFVETYHAGGRSVYLPGSSLKGAIRAHAERIVRTVGSDKRPTSETKSDKFELWADDPLKNENSEYYKKLPSAEIYKQSSFTDQIFGNTSIASRIRIQDAYPTTSIPLKIEERNGVAIDRVFGSAVRGALFNYEVCTSGDFRTKIHLKNFSLAQLGLIGLVLRDLDDGWFGIGFAKSRGMGTVKLQYHSAVVQYPGCELRGDRIYAIGKELNWSNKFLLGAGEFLQGKDENPYKFPINDKQDTIITAEEMSYGFGVQLTWTGEDDRGVPDLFERAVRQWREILPKGVGA